MNSTQTSYPKNYVVPTEPQPVKQKASLWDEKYIIENLPPWVYQDNPEPTSVADCEATLCRLEHTIDDIELQIKIREFEMETGTGRQQTKYEHDKWVSQALRAKQTHKYLLSAYKYWYIINKKDIQNKSSAYNVGLMLSNAICDLCKILKEDPVNFEDQLDTLKEKLESYVKGLEV